MPVVDASVVVDWVAPGSDQGAAAGDVLRRLVDGGLPVLGPRLLAEEVANALLTGVRRKRWSGSDSDASFELLRELPVQYLDQPDDLRRAWDLSRRYDEHPVYDMVYVAVAERVGEVLITADRRLWEKTRGLGIVIDQAAWLLG